MLPRRISNSIRQADFLNIINSVGKQRKITDRAVNVQKLG